MRKIFLLTIALIFIMTACNSQPAAQSLPETSAPQEISTTPTSQPVPTDEPVTTEVPIPTEPMATETAATKEETVENVASASGLVVFNIIPGETQLQYEVGEVFINDSNRFAVAIGVTPQVEGEIQIDRAAPQNSTMGAITADISQFKSDSGRRDNAIRGRFLESERYPNVTFVPTQIEGLPNSFQEGQEIPLKITGDLMIRDVTRPVSFDATVKLEGDQLTGQAMTTILMSEFEFGPINVAGILKTEDEAKVTLTFVARP